MAQSNFAAQVDSWVASSNRRMNAVFRESVQRTVARMQTPVGAGGNMPVDTGFLRSSLVATVNTPEVPLQLPPEGPRGTHGYRSGPITLTIRSAQIGDVIYILYTANYARHVEYGSNGRAGRGFVRLAAQQWPQIVAQVVAEARQRGGA